MIYGRIWGIPPISRAEIMELARAIKMEFWRPGITPPTLEPSEELAKIITLKEQLIKLRKEFTGRVISEKFEKDDDRNSHIDFIAASANIRALNYRIPVASKLEIKRLAGKIVPAIATTTAMICGFVCLEMYKLHSTSKKSIGDFRSGFINLGISMFALAEPIAAPKQRLGGTDDEFVPLWDHPIVADEVRTLKQFIDWVQSQFKAELFAVIFGSKQVWTSYQLVHQERLLKTLEEIVEITGGQPISPAMKFVRFEAYGNIHGTDKDALIPSLTYKLHH
jgi:ubiquitin-activating enzyme E1